MPEHLSNPVDKPVGSNPLQSPASARIGSSWVRPLSAVLGAEIEGVDLANDSDWQLIRQAFLEFQLLVLRNQNVDDETFGAFAERFGEPQNSYLTTRAQNKAVQYISNLDAQGNPVANPGVNGNYFWHTDQQYYPRTSLLTMLSAVELPESGGDTEFANMIAAYDALSDDTKSRLNGLMAVYSYQHMIRTCANRPPTREEIEKAPPTIHPLVRTHPETGKKSLFLGSYCAEVVGMPQSESRRLIADLSEHATQPRFIYRHVWRKGDLILWDNRCLIHRALANFEMGKQRRILRRVVVKGSVPF